MELRINGFPLNKRILLIDSNHKSVMAVLGCKNHCEVYLKEMNADLACFENSKFVAWCYPPDAND